MYLSHHQHFWTSLLDINVFLPGFALEIHLFSVTSAMLHRYTQSFSVQYFSNLGLKGNTIEFCSCPISYSFFKIALRYWGYLLIREMGNFAGRGIFIWWWEPEEEWFWPFKHFLEWKNNTVKIYSVGINVKFYRDIFFYWVVEFWEGVILTIRTILPSCFEICEGFLWIREKNWKHGKKILQNINLYIDIA